MLASRTRAALRIGSVLYLILGLVLFAAPAWAASEFPWSVSPFVAMTIGGWMLGNGVGVWFASARGPAPRVLPILAYVAAFSAGELLVVLAFRGALQLGVILAIPYLLTLGFTLIAAAFGILELRTTTSIVVEVEAPLEPRVRGGLLGLTAFVGLLGAAGFIAGTGGLSTTGQIFPEPLTLFSVRAFAAFYVALVVGLVVLIAQPGVGSAFMLGIAGVALIVPIVLATLAHLSAFDFARRPLGVLYLATYLVVLAPAGLFLWRHRAELYA